MGVCLVGLLAWTAAGMGPVFGWRAPWLPVLWWLALALAIGGAGVAAAAMVRLRRLRLQDER